MKRAIAILLGFFLTACASNDPFLRKATGLGQGAILYVQSSQVEPVLRPFSYLVSRASLIVKSVGGTLGRVAINGSQLPALTGEIPGLAHAPPMDLIAWEAILDDLTGTQQTLGTVNFLIDGPEYFERLESAIANASRSIDMRTYIFDNDDYAVAVADRIKARSNADVRVRIMLDSLGNLQAMQTDPDSMPSTHRTPLSMTMYLEENSHVNVRNIGNPYFTGDHTKTTIIDKQVAFVGGMNIGREYRYDWHDLMMELHGPVVDQLQFESDKAWSRAGLLGDLGNVLTFVRGMSDDAGTGGYPVRILKTRNFDSDIYKAQIAAMRNARRYILIENAYFSDDRTLYELAHARRRGVDVRIILPSTGNHGPLNASNDVAINQLLKHGVRVYRYPGMSHVKAAIFDGWACVGSANFDKLSLKINKELNIATSDAATVTELIERVFIPDLMISREITEPIPVNRRSYVAEILVDELL
jgi:cardiolipin synthase